jgi:hypothetical protein
LLERALCVLAAVRAERWDLAKRGPRRTFAGAKRSVDRVARIRSMDDALITDKGRGYLGTWEERLPAAVMYELAKRPLEHCDLAYDWPLGTAVALRHRYPEKWQSELNKLIDNAVGHFQQARLTILEQITSACPNAVKIVTAAMEGEEWNGSPVSKDQRLAAENLLKTFRDLMKDDFTPASMPETEVDEETEAMAAHAERMGVDGLGEETN